MATPHRNTAPMRKNIALLPLQRDLLRPLRTLLLQNGSRHLALTIDLEIKEGPPGVLEARLGSGEEGDLRIGSRLHEERLPVAADRHREPGRRLVLTDVAVEDGHGQRNAGWQCRRCWRSRRRSRGK